MAKVLAAACDGACHPHGDCYAVLATKCNLKKGVKNGFVTARFL